MRGQRIEFGGQQGQQEYFQLSQGLNPPTQHQRSALVTTNVPGFKVETELSLEYQPKEQK